MLVLAVLKKSLIFLWSVKRLSGWPSAESRSQKTYIFWFLLSKWVH